MGENLKKRNKTGAQKMSKEMTLIFELVETRGSFNSLIRLKASKFPVVTPGITNMHWAAKTGACPSDFQNKAGPWVTLRV